MRIIVTHYGGPDELRVVEEECPEPKDGEVRVRVLAAGVSLPDLLMREGVHPETPPAAFHAGVGSCCRGGSARRRCLWNRTRPDNCRAADHRSVRGVRLPAAT
jgi:D-arabinose 1-dehydrogenase-like Zn-dependent alcohol dehydrogenase